MAPVGSSGGRRSRVGDRGGVDTRGEFDDRGVSTVVGYTLNFAVATLLVVLLFTAAGGFVGDQHERVVRSELQVLGERVAADVATADRLARTSDGGIVRVRVDLPARVAGSPYRIRVSPAAEEVVLTADDPDVTVRVPYDTGDGDGEEAPIDVAATTVQGGRLVVVYDGAGPLEVIPGE